MLDYRTRSHGHDRHRINMHRDDKVRNWAKILNTTPERLKEALQIVVRGREGAPLPQLRQAAVSTPKPQEKPDPGQHRQPSPSREDPEKKEPTRPIQQPADDDLPETPRTQPD